MADQDSSSQDASGGVNGDDGQPQVATIAQYIKDLSVENPNAPAVYQWPPSQPQLDVQFHINVSKIGEEVHEVALKIDATARSEQGTNFVVDLTYAGLFGIRNLPEEALAPFLLAEAPRLMFPFARAIIANATQDCGFPPLLLDPIDFAAAYMAQAQAEGGATGEPTIQ